MTDWPDIPHGCLVLMAAVPPKTPTERSRARYWRDRQGLKPLVADLPAAAFAQFLISEGYLSRDDMDDGDEVREAHSRFLQDLINANRTPCKRDSDAGTGEGSEPE